MVASNHPATDMETVIIKTLLRYKRRLFTALSYCDRDNPLDPNGWDTIFMEVETAKEILALLER